MFYWYLIYNLNIYELYHFIIFTLLGPPHPIASQTKSSSTMHYLPTTIPTMSITHDITPITTTTTPITIHYPTSITHHYPLSSPSYPYTRSRLPSLTAPAPHHQRMLIGAMDGLYVFDFDEVQLPRGENINTAAPPTVDLLRIDGLGEVTALISRQDLNIAVVITGQC